MLNNNNKKSVLLNKAIKPQQQHLNTTQNNNKLNERHLFNTQFVQKRQQPAQPVHETKYQ